MVDEEMATSADLAKAMEMRAAFYRFMGDALLSELTSEQLEDIVELGLLEVDGLPDVDDDRRFAEALLFLDQPLPDAQEAAAADFAQLFSEGTGAAVPRESVFTGEQVVCDQEVRDAVAGMYREHGFEDDPMEHVLDDHLGLGLEYIAALSERSAKALWSLAMPQQDAEDGELDEKGLLSSVAELAQAQRDYLESHVLSWMPLFVDRVDAVAQTPLYPAFARLVTIYAQQDVHLLDELSQALAS